MKLYLIQHGKARSKEEDHLRGLNKDGIAETIKTAHFLARTNPAPVEILHSEKLRAEQTAEIFAEKLINKLGVREYEKMGPNDSPTPILEYIEKSINDLMIIGHLPFLPKLLSQLLFHKDERCPVQFRNSGVICLEREGEDWFIQWIIHPDFTIFSE